MQGDYDREGFAAFLREGKEVYHNEGRCDINDCPIDVICERCGYEMAHRELFEHDCAADH